MIAHTKTDVLPAAVQRQSGDQRSASGRFETTRERLEILDWQEKRLLANRTEVEALQLELDLRGDGLNGKKCK